MAKRSKPSPLGPSRALTGTMYPALDAEAGGLPAELRKALEGSDAYPIGGIAGAFRKALEDSKALPMVGIVGVLGTPAKYRSPDRHLMEALGKPGASHSAALAPSAVSDAGIRADSDVVRSVADVGVRVRAARRAMGMTQQRFADLAGVGRRFLVELEKGKPSLEMGRVLNVCRAAGIKLVVLS